MTVIYLTEREDGPLFCDCVVPIHNVIRFYGLDMGDCAACERPIRKENP